MRCHDNETIDGGSWMSEVISWLAGYMRLCDWQNVMIDTSCCQLILKLKTFAILFNHNQKQQILKMFLSRLWFYEQREIVGW